MPNLRPVCLVVSAPESSGVDADYLFHRTLGPAIERAGLRPQRVGAQDTTTSLREQLSLAEVAVIDLSGNGHQSLYGMGVRDALHPARTQYIHTAGTVAVEAPSAARVLVYDIDDAGAIVDCDAFRAALQEGLLRRMPAAAPGDPMVRLLQPWSTPLIARLKTDVFRRQVEYSPYWRQRLQQARSAGDVTALVEIEVELGELAAHESAVLVDLLLSYRAVDAWQQLVALVSRLPPILRSTVLVQEQLGFALNRMGRDVEALAVLDAVLARQGPSSETCPLIGRVYKDRWVRARREGDDEAAAVALDLAINFYSSGFEADTRDAYPGINALTLLELKGDATALAHKAALLPVVAHAVERRIAAGAADYWDYASRLELAVLSGAATAADACLEEALSRVRESWEPGNTAANLRLIRAGRKRLGQVDPWLDAIIAGLQRAAGEAGEAGPGRDGGSGH